MNDGFTMQDTKLAGLEFQVKKLEAKLHVNIQEVDKFRVGQDSTDTQHNLREAKL